MNEIYHLLKVSTKSQTTTVENHLKIGCFEQKIQANNGCFKPHASLLLGFIK
jgi:hypothetical protein